MVGEQTAESSDDDDIYADTVADLTRRGFVHARQRDSARSFTVIRRATYRASSRPLSAAVSTWGITRWIWAMPASVTKPIRITKVVQRYGPHDVTPDRGDFHPDPGLPVDPEQDV